MQHQKKSWYRPDIDGLRAIAIIAVLLFHAKTAGFTGGYVGVDIFFVISGFLITSIIVREIKEKRFSLLTFWERRMRRIIPALTVVLSFTLALGYFIILFPIDFIDLGQSTLAQSLFLANIFFMRNSGYFAGPSETAPLLHMWSLSVEEQFYIIFPLLMLLLFRYARKLIIPILIAIGILSLIYAYYLISLTPGNSFSLPGVPNIWANATNAKAAFFMLPARAFELIIGAVLALTTFTVAKRSVAELLSWSGLVMILYAIFAFTPETAFPGLYALLPTLGTAAIILANTKHQTSLGAFLSFPLFVGIGLISYSLYLWHWPLLVFAKVHLNTDILTTTQTLSMLLLACVLSYLTYRFVETPFREKRALARRTPMLVGGFASLLILASIGYFISFSNGMPERVSDKARAVAEASVDFWDRRSECFVNSFNTTNEPCYIGNQAKDTVDFVVAGDSHGASLLPVIDATAKESGLRGATFLSPGCLPVFGTSPERIVQKCEDVKRLAEAFTKEHDVQNVILVSRWSSYNDIVPHSPEEAALVGGLTKKEAAAFLFTHALKNTATQYKEDGRQLFLITQVPFHSTYNARTLFYNAVKDDDNTDVRGISYEAHVAYSAFIYDTFSDLARTERNVSMYDPADVLCPDKQECLLVQDGVLLYENADHINMTGSYFLTPLFSDLFESL